MKKFKFNLESVLTVKEKNLEDERLALAKAMNYLNKQKEILDELNSELKKSEVALDNYLAQNEVNVIVFETYSNYIKNLNHKIVSQIENIRKATIELNKQQIKTKEAYIGVKTLEKLKEKQKESYNKEVMMEEFKLLDDIVNSKRIAI